MCICRKRKRNGGGETHFFACSDGAIAKDCVDYFYPISIFEKDKILKECEQIGIDGIVATTELTIAVVGYIANAMHLNCNELMVSEVITVKYRNREVTTNIDGLNHP